MSDIDQQLAPATTPAKPARQQRREERPKFSLKEDLGYRISGLEQAKLEPNMTEADKAALDRMIVKLTRQKTEKEAAKTEKKEQDEV